MRLCPHVLIACVALLAGCATHTVAFVEKSEAELEALESRAKHAASLCTAGEFAKSIDIFADIGREPTVSQPLYMLDAVPPLLFAGRRDDAHKSMVDLRGTFEELYAPESEKKALSRWHGEVNKVFKGEVHEISTFYALLAMSYADRGEIENAWRCVQNGILHDCDSEHERYQSDYALLLYLGSVYAAMTGEIDSAQQCRIRLEEALKFRGAMYDREKSPDAPAAALFSDECPNAMVAVWTGTPPRFGLGGAHGEKRTILRGDESAFDYVAVADETGREHIVPQRLGDINYQASTRGGREMDGVLRDKADFKEDMISYKKGADAVSDGFYQAGLPVDPVGKTAGAVLGTVAKGVAGIFSSVSDSVDAHADIRSWRTLPGQLDVLPLRLTPGVHNLLVRGYSSGSVVHETKISVMVPGNGGIGVAHVKMTGERGRYASVQRSRPPSSGKSSQIAGVWRTWLEAEAKKGVFPNDASLARYLPKSGEIAFELLDDGTARVTELEDTIFGCVSGNWKHRHGLLELKLTDASGKSFTLSGMVKWHDADSFELRFMANEWRDMMKMRLSGIGEPVMPCCNYQNGKMKVALVSQGKSPRMAECMCALSVFRRQWGLRSTGENKR